MAEPSEPSGYTLETLSDKERFIVAFSRLFSYLTPEESGSLLSRAEQKTFPKGDVILKEGSTDKALFIIVKGEVNVVQGTPRTTIARLGVGSIFGEMSFLEQDRASATVVADDGLELFRVDGQIINNLIEDSPRFAAHFYQSLSIILSRRLRVTNTLLSDSAEQEKPRDRKGLKFYVVDDDQDLVQLMSLFLQKDGHKVMSNTSAILAIPEILSFRPDCVLTDLMMSEMDGLEFCRELRSRPELSKTKIIMVSVWSEDVWASRAVDSGADGFMTKPLNEETFVSNVLKLIEK